MSKNEGGSSQSGRAESGVSDSAKDAVPNTGRSHPLVQHDQLPGKSVLPANNALKATNSTSQPGNPNPTDNTAAKDERAVPRPDPTRYGDWEKNGRCIDF